MYVVVCAIWQPCGLLRSTTFTSPWLRITYKTLCRLRTLHHCHPFKKKKKKGAKSFKRVWMFSNTSLSRACRAGQFFLSSSAISGRPSFPAEVTLTAMQERRDRNTHTHIRGCTHCHAVHTHCQETWGGSFQIHICWGLFASTYSHTHTYTCGLLTLYPLCPLMKHEPALWPLTPMRAKPSWWWQKQNELVNEM